MIPKKTDRLDSKTSKQQLLDEIERLQQQFAELEDKVTYREDQLRVVSKGLKFGFWEWDLVNDCFISYSDEIAVIFGLSIEAFGDRYRCLADFYDSIHPEDLHHFKKHAGRGSKYSYPPGEANVFDYRVILPGGDVRFVRQLDFRVTDDQGIATKSYGTVQDITEQQKGIKRWSLHPESLAAREFSRAITSTGEAVDLSILRETGGDSKKAQRHILSAYIHALPQILGNIQNAFTQRNPEQLCEFARKLESSSRGIGAIQLAEICDRLEIAGKQDNWAEIETAMPQFQSLARQVEAFIVAFCEDHSLDANVEPMFGAESNIDEIDLSVLLVDDDPIMHRVSTMILNDLGINNVRSAISGSKALEMLDKEGAIDVVICDLNMSEMDGIEFIRHLAAQSFSGSLVLTSREDIRILRTVEKLAIEHELNLLGVLEKPVTPVKLREILDVLEQATADGTVLSTEIYEADELLQAIEGNQLDTYFQPKIDVNTGQIVGAEALVRWNHPSRGIVRPYYFISLAEENNLITKLTQAVCAKALQHVATLKARGYNLGIALNISVDTLNDLSWPDTIASQIELAGLQPSAVTFEITESRLMVDTAVSLDILSRLSLKRFNLAIDDFGTGYSSMEQLQRIPFSELKIDRAFVSGASADSSARAILESSIQLARKLDMKIVAEGVGTRQDWDLIAELGCDEVQGYYIARPMPIDQFLEWLDRWNLSEHLQSMP